jgi:hypothetical protein
MRHVARIATFGVVAPALGALLSCSAANFLNPAFLNQETGNIFALAPGDRSNFILVRGNNATSVNVEFLVTVERIVPSEDDPNVFVPQLESVRLFTPSGQRANDLGALFDCGVTRIGLGRVLDRPTTEPGVFVGAEAVGVGGLGIPPNINPLSAAVGNFDCGDTIVFQVAEASNTVGGVVVAAYVLDDEEFSTNVIGFDTFVAARSLLEEQQLEQD